MRINDALVWSIEINTSHQLIARNEYIIIVGIGLLLNIESIDTGSKCFLVATLFANSNIFVGSIS